MIFTGLDPTADDATPEFADRLGTLPSQYGLFELFEEALAKEDYKTAWGLLQSNFEQANSDPSFLVGLSFKTQRFFERVKAGTKHYQWFKDNLQRAYADLCLRDGGSELLPFLQYLIGEADLALGNYDRAKAIFNDLLSRAGLGQELRESVFYGLLDSLEGLGRREEIGRLVKDKLTAKEPFSFLVRVKDGKISSPLLRYFPAKATLILEVSGNRYLIRGGKKAVALPKELRPYQKRLEGERLTISYQP